MSSPPAPMASWPSPPGVNVRALAPKWILPGAAILPVNGMSDAASEREKYALNVPAADRRNR